MGKKKNTITKKYYEDLWIDRLSNLACNMFEWNGLPPEINKDAMEKIIMLNGYAIFFYDKDVNKYICLNGVVSGIDIYGYPTKAKPVPKNGIMFKELTVDKDCVIIYANRTRTAAMPYILDYADKLSDLDVAIKMNTKAMKHPINIKGSEQTKASLDTLFKQYDDDYYMVFTDKQLKLDDSIEAINFNVSAKEILDLQKQKETILNEYFALYGISGTSEKRERMISGEINAILQQVGINRKIWLSTRQDATDKINKIFGLNISVDSTQVNFENFTDETKNPKPNKEKEDNND